MVPRVWTLRFLKFNGVGVIGFVVQIAVLAVLLHRGFGYLTATGLAVEAALLHNYLWHEGWTWGDRPIHGSARLRRLWQFHALNGFVSLAGNVLLMLLLVGGFGVAPIPANLVAVLVCSLMNFVLSDRLVFDSEMPLGRRDEDCATGGDSSA
jgi:putative flippase GtrA